MADGISLAASIIAVLELSSRVLEYAKAVKDGQSERARLYKEIVNTQGTLQSLKSHVERAAPNDSWTQAVLELNRPGGPLEIYKAALERLLKKIGPASNPQDGQGQNVLKRARTNLAWPFQAGEVANILATLERQERLFSLALSQDSMALSRAIRDDIEDDKRIHRVMTSDLSQARNQIRDILDKSRSDTERKVLEWLSSIRPHKNHIDISARRTPGTGAWVRQSQQFHAWLENTDASNVLWCSGIPGAGKTFIASMVIDHLESLAVERQFILAYEYCDYKYHPDQPGQALSSIAGSLLWKIMASQAKIPDDLIQLFQQNRGPDKTSQSSRLEEFLISFCNERQVYIVIDALDESGQTGDRRPLFKLLKRLEATRAKFFYTTRPDQKDIERHLRDHPRIVVEASEPDIISFLEQKIEERLEEEEELEDLLTQSLREEIISTLVARAHGMSVDDVAFLGIQERNG